MTLTSDAKGFAGLSNRNNVYSFKIESVGQNCKLRYWASGDIGTDTYGEVLIKVPDGVEHVVDYWEPKRFTMPAKSVDFYRKLKEAECDITDYITDIGEYKIEFRYLKGLHGLSILHVELEIK